MPPRINRKRSLASSRKPQASNDSEYTISEDSGNLLSSPGPLSSPSLESSLIEKQDGKGSVPIGIVVRQQRIDEFLIQIGYRNDDLDQTSTQHEKILDSMGWDVNASVAEWNSSKATSFETQVGANAPRVEDDENTEEPTKARQNSLLRDFKSIVGPKVTDQIELRCYLRGYKWNVLKASKQWQIDRAKLVREQEEDQLKKGNMRRATTQNSRKSKPISYSGRENDNVNKKMNLAQSRIPFSNNVEQERRDSAVVFHLILKRDRNINLSCSESILLLYIASWDIDKALKAFGGMDGALDSLSEAFDHMRTANPGMIEKDERLASLLAITQRVDVISVVDHLVSSDWNFVNSVVAWFNEGIPVSKSRKALNTKWRRKDHDGRARSMPSSAEVKPMNQQKSITWAPEADEFVEGGSALKPTRPTASKIAPQRKQGFALDDDRQTLQKGVPNPSKFIHEYIQNGKLKQNIFKPKKFKWLPDTFYPKTSQLGNLPRFDWNNAADIEIANSWRRQVFARTTQNFIRPASQVFTKDMNDYLYELSEEYCRTLTEKKNLKRIQVIPFTVPHDIKKQWQKDFNKKFVGTKPQGCKEPVRSRSIGALMTQRSRIEEICKDFGVASSTDRDLERDQRDWARRQAAEIDRCKGVDRKRKHSWFDDEEDDEEVVIEAGPSKRTKPSL